MSLETIGKVRLPGILGHFELLKREDGKYIVHHGHNTCFVGEWEESLGYYETYLKGFESIYKIVISHETLIGKSVSITRDDGKEVGEGKIVDETKDRSYFKVDKLEHLFFKRNREGDCHYSHAMAYSCKIVDDDKNN